MEFQPKPLPFLIAFPLCPETSVVWRETGMLMYMEVQQNSKRLGLYRCILLTLRRIYFDWEWPSRRASGRHRLLPQALGGSTLFLPPAVGHRLLMKARLTKQQVHLNVLTTPPQRCTFCIASKKRLASSSTWIIKRETHQYHFLIQTLRTLMVSSL